MSPYSLGSAQLSELLGTSYGALILDSEDEYNAVIQALTEALADMPSNANALNNLGVAWAELGDRLRAREYFEQALALLPGDALVSSNLSRLADRE